MGLAGVFIDRDGTLIEERDFLRDPDGLTLIPGSGEAVAKLNQKGIPVCIISNQSGVARGLLSEADLVLLHERLVDELAVRNAHVDAIYYCPHHPTEGNPPYRMNCDCRKPKTGMIDRGARELGIDLSRSFVVGDKLVDIQAGSSAGARTVLVLTGYGKDSAQAAGGKGIRPDHVAADLPEAIGYILQNVEPGTKRGN